jgi:histidinol-phosphate/aromatic aminotransferase/cobyric acid decarboxylase-like protein
VSLPGQVAAVKALQDPAYYAARHAETHRLRGQLSESLRPLGLEIVPSVTNFLLCHLPAGGPDAATVVSRCRQHGVFLRDAGVMGSQMGGHALRIAVKDAAANQRLVEVLKSALA